MNTNWSICKLSDVADVRVSNVDKKTSNAETPVKLCNYMDVYTNDYVTGSIDFMAASASKSEIDRFGLQPGDVLITKDSETPDDIGVSAVVADSIDGSVCGYHLALIRPRNCAINSIYLAKQLASAPIAHYFSMNANGSTRFGLPINVIEDTQIPIAPELEQTKIAKILSTVDRVIEQTEMLIAKQQRVKIGLMQDLLTRGIDEHGNLRSERNHQFKDSPLGRIPTEWEIKQLNDVLSTKQYGISTNLIEEPIGVPVLRMNNLSEGDIDYSDLKYSNEPATLKLLLNDGDVLFNRTNSIDYVGRTAIYRHKGTPVSFASYLVRLVPGRTILLPEYLNFWLNSATNQIRVRQLATVGVQQANVNPTNLGTLEAAIPGSFKEQELIVNAITAYNEGISNTQENLDKICAIRTALMQDLLTGVVRTGRIRVTNHSLECQFFSDTSDRLRD